MPGWEDPTLRRGATSVALVDPGAETNILFEATPNLPQQLYQLQVRNSFPLSGIFLTHAHIGHYAGLMFLGREAMGASGVPVFAMPRMQEYLSSNGPWDQLVSLDNIRLNSLQHQQSVEINNFSITPFLVPHRDEYSETVGFEIRGPEKSALFIPDINKWEDWSVDLVELVGTVDYALIDATFYADGELGNRDMSRIPHPFVTETMALFEGASSDLKNRIWFIHFNHTNPLLDPNSSESEFVRAQGFNIARENILLPL